MCNDDSPLAVFHLEGSHAVPQGADWDVAILYTENNIPLDFSTATAVMQIRKDYDKDIILELSSANGTITLGTGINSTPNVILNFKSADTSPMTSYTGIYDLEVTTAAGVIKKFLEGNFQLRRQVTK